MTWNESPQNSNTVPGDGSQQSLVESAISALREAVSGSSGDVAFLWTGGKEANVIADMLLYSVGDTHEGSPIPFITIDTGNHLDEMYSFRQEYTLPSGDKGADTVGPFTGVDDWRVIRNDGLLDGVIRNNNDPRGFHGEWDSSVNVPDDCPVNGLPKTSDGWGVEDSCGALKVVPMRKLIRDEGFETIITGRRSEDPLADDGLPVFNQRHTPAPHERVNPLSDWSEQNVYAYVKRETVPLPSLYTERGYRHTDAECCIDPDSQIGEYGEGGRDPEKRQAQERLEDMGYV